MKYTVQHKTVYTYSAPVHQSYHLLHLSPCEVERQSVHDHKLTMVPQPQRRIDGKDFFGNPYSILTLAQDHTQFEVNVLSVIDVAPLGPLNLDQTSAWEIVARREWQAGAAPQKDIWQFAAASRYGRLLAEAAEYAGPSFPKGRPILSGVRDLTRRIHNDFEFDPTATDVSTPVETVFKHRRGVCQDFAHLQISCLRSLNLPARYVSGYILTHPPDGQERLQGADASHAWLSAWSPETGWVDFDPTNDLVPDVQHVTIAYGRDYDDVCPISGVLLGGGAHTVSVAVDVIPWSAGSKTGD